MRRNSILAMNIFAALGLVFGIGRGCFAQVPQPDRIGGPIAGSPVVWLAGNRRPIFQPENDRGPVADSLQLENLSLVFKLTASQQAELTALLDAQQDPTSPNFHHWLTPEEYADRFGLSPHDIQQVVTWLLEQGFQVTHTARGRSWVSFSGTAARVRAAFQTEIHDFSLRGRTYYANALEPAVPAGLAAVVLGIQGLDNYRLRPRTTVRRLQAGPAPDSSSALNGRTFVTPSDFAVIYDVDGLYNSGIDGTGQTIAVMGQTDLYENGSDVTAFRSAARLPANNPTLQLDPNSQDPGVLEGDIDEASLDVEWSGAVARNASIIYFYSTDVVNLSLYDAIDQNLAPVISISYGACESDWGATALMALAQNTQRANSQGQTIVAATGDAGQADCDVPTNSNSTVTAARHGFAVDAPASMPYVTGVGGSEFYEDSGVYWKTATTSTREMLTSALSYIPEMAWNDTASPGNTGKGLLAGGGGASTFVPPGAPPKPNWQRGRGVPDDNARDVPDLSLNASPIHDPLLICLQGTCMNGFREVSANPSVHNVLTVVGGTSAAASTFAGIVALINQQKNTPAGQGNINRTLYSMAASTPAAFHDITVGNNMVPCEKGIAGCPDSGEIVYGAEAGYDRATGWGSVDAYNLVEGWGAPAAGNFSAATLSNASSFDTAAPDFSLSASPSALMMDPGTSATSTLTVTPIGDFTATPTFTCSVSSSLVGVKCSVGALSNNTATVTITASTRARSYPEMLPGSRLDGWRVAGLVVICLLLMALSRLCFGVPNHPWNARRVALTAVLAGLILAGHSCGGQNSGGGMTTSAAESGTVTVTGISSSLTHNTSISVSVNYFLL